MRWPWKVPEYSPWAPHAFRRLLYQLRTSLNVYENRDKNYSQNEGRPGHICLKRGTQHHETGQSP